ncbi:hypothetical protein NIES4071_108370 (plasmid) [Calothrix sp. NIES-4071]|nr:hypothetical protein NIES4071_108370 [Calothrix sp. NIES-4071]BAZ64877.1 hypothetical protein NIES4105_106100 [Calothrix sp. NIES-4105]
MTPEQLELWFEIHHRQMVALERIADTLDSLVPKTVPNIQRPIEEFKTFDWSTIGARVDNSDSYGPTVVSWRGLRYTRRCPQNKFGVAIFYSRCVGKDEDGANKYERLITFKPFSNLEVEPLSLKAQNQIG